MTTPAKFATLSLGICLVALFMTLGPARADQWQPLRDDARIHQGLTVIAIGRHIRNACPSIDARMVRFFTYAEGLVNHAQDLGFSRAEINAYIDNRSDQERYRQIARDYFSARGYDQTVTESICQAGRDEIAAGSEIGRLLRGG